MTGKRAVDHAILGGGCAGLALAAALSEQRPDRSVAVIEPRTAFPRDRTWCYWDLETHPFAGAVAHRWARWKVRHAGVETVHGAGRLRYCEVPADAYYRTAIARLEQRPSVELCLGTRVLGLEERDDCVRVSTDRGAVRARCAFDSRPGARAPDPDGLLQHFVGLHVRAEDAPFDPGVVTLMDFDVSQAHGIHFVYVLPYARDRALVEATFLSPRALPEEVHLEAIDRYLGERHRVRAYEIQDRERGVIPMSARPVPARPSRRIYRIGTAGGLVKPSTGYAFLAIQRFTRELAGRLAREDLPAPPEVRDRTARRLDAVFLAFLKRHPRRAPEIFARLFDRVEPERLVRFLGDTATLGDRLRVIRAMPALPFARTAWRARREWVSDWVSERVSC